MEDENVKQYKIDMYQIMVPVFLIISSIAFLANLLVIIALRETKVRNATVILITSLTISDMWLAHLLIIEHIFLGRVRSLELRSYTTATCQSSKEFIRIIVFHSR